jgi:hypothetical protein
LLKASTETIQGAGKGAYYNFRHTRSSAIRTKLQ